MNIDKLINRINEYIYNYYDIYKKKNKEIVMEERNRFFNEVIIKNINNDIYDLTIEYEKYDKFWCPRHDVIKKICLINKDVENDYNSYIISRWLEYDNNKQDKIIIEHQTSKTKEIVIEIYFNDNLIRILDGQIYKKYKEYKIEIDKIDLYIEKYNNKRIILFIMMIKSLLSV